MTPEQAYKLVSERAEPPEMEEPYWIEDYEFYDNGDDYCRTCVVAAPLLPQLVVCHLLALIGVDVTAPQQHEWGRPSYSGARQCYHCDEVWHGTPKETFDACRSWPQRALDRAEGAQHGGWADESDHLETCDFCGVDLKVILTDYAIDMELAHWEENGPPETGRGWWELNEAVDGLLNYWMPDVEKKEPRWGRVIALLTKWGITPEASRHHG